MHEQPLYLLDTNVLVALIRAGPLGKAIDERFSLRQAKFKPLLCVVSVGELLSLARQFGWAAKKLADLQALLGNLITVDINAPETLAAYAEIDQLSRAAGRTMSKNDLWIAAVARVTGATLLTTDKDYDHLAANPPVISRILIDERSILSSN